MRVVLTDDPTQFALGLTAIVVGAHPPVFSDWGHGTEPSLLHRRNPAHRNVHGRSMTTRFRLPSSPRSACHRAASDLRFLDFAHLRAPTAAFCRDRSSA